MTGSNLYPALQHLRSQNEDRILWIDAMCIDQADDSERGHQVVQMGQIYANVVFVRIWLGLATLGTEKLFSYLRTQHARPRHHYLTLIRGFIKESLIDSAAGNIGSAYGSYRRSC